MAEIDGLKARFQTAVRHSLEPLSPALTKALRKIVRKELDEETYLIDFEVHSRGYPAYEERDFSFGLRWDAMDAEVGQLDDGGYVLGRDGVVIPKEIYWAPEYQELHPNKLAFRVLVDWFSGCWDKAGGAECDYPAYITHHDSSESFDLKAKLWVENNTKWP